MNPKIITFYLPQFHTIPENNSWWWEGFTEWVNVRKSKPLFKSHVQPRIPLDANYYNLLELHTQEWQARIAKENWVDGFCYYHYWFEWDQLLEKPAENMLQSPSVDIPFCFSWANHDWTRTWWWPGKNQLLKKQTYWDKKAWKTHFEYLLQFFRDERYIKVENKPVFLIYHTAAIDCLKDMLQSWHDWATEAGFDGIYLIETLNSIQRTSITEYSQGVLEFEPLYTFQYELTIFHKLKLIVNKTTESLFDFTAFVMRYSYAFLWRRILDRKVIRDKHTFFCGFVDWDNSPRKWRRAYIVDDATPGQFWWFMCELIAKTKRQDKESPLLFLNAWNEWAEWVYLEPDEHSKFQYLEELKKIHNNL
jgi:hypothetical protein